jgi:aminopeptidase N
VRSGLTSASDYWQLIKTFSREDDVNVWSIISSSVQALHLLLSGENRIAFKKMIRGLFGPPATKLGWSPKAGESVQTKQLRAQLLEVLGTIGEDAPVINSAVEHFNKWKQDNAAIDSNLLPALVTILAYNGNATRYEEFSKLSQEAKTPQELIRFLYALAAFRDLTLLNKTMASCVSGEVKTQDAPYLFAAIAQNEIATTSAWQYLKTHWDRMVEIYPENGVVRMCAAILPALDQSDLEKDANGFFAKHKVAGGDMAIAQGLELLRVNLLMRERESKRFGSYVLSNASKC